jgi:hypothetical protein
MDTFAMSFVRDAAAQTINGDEDRGPFKHLHQAARPRPVHGNGPSAGLLTLGQMPEL